MSRLGSERGAGEAVAGGFFKIALYVFVAVLIIWIGKSTYSLGYNIFNQKPMSSGEGQEVTVVIKEGSSVYQMGKALENKGLIKDAKVFYIQERLSDYKGQLKAGTYVLSTSQTPEEIMQALAQGSEVDGSTGS